MIGQLSIAGRDKIDTALRNIEMYCPPEGYWVGVSGGKDSSVTVDLMERAGVPYDGHFNVCGGVDPPEVIRFLKRYYPQVERHVPEKSMFDLIVQKRGVPTGQRRWCCDIFKERGGEGRIVVTGVRRAESRARSCRRVFQVDDRTHKLLVQPIIDWSDEEVWEYLRYRDLPHCSLYDEGFKRIGCAICPKARARMRFEAERFPLIARAYKRAMQTALDLRVEEGRPLPFEDAEAFFEWWTDPGRKDDAATHAQLFEK